MSIMITLKKTYCRKQATLPATGRYLLTVAEQPQWVSGTPFLGASCVTLQSSQAAWQTLVPTTWVEGYDD